MPKSAYLAKALTDILKLAGNGILVSGFNGGNCNPVTGDFSFGIEGFAFSKGKISHPVREMLITGNMNIIGLVAAVAVLVAMVVLIARPEKKLQK